MHSASNAHAAAAAKSSHHRKASHSNTSSLSSTSSSTLKRASSLKASSSANPSHPPAATLLDPPIEDESPPDVHKKLRKRSSTHRRRSTVAHVAQDQVSSPIREGVGNLHRWSQSSTSSRASLARELRQGSFSRRLSFSSGPPLDPLHGSALQSPQRSPTRNRSPDVSPRGKARPYSPPPKIPTPDPAPALPLLPATTFDPSSPLTAATSFTPTPGLFTPPAALSSGPDYFNHKPFAPAASPRSKKPPPPKGFAKSALASPPILESASNRSAKPPHSSSASVSSRSRAASVEQQQQRSGSALGKERRAPTRERTASRTRDRSVSGTTTASEDEGKRAPSRNKDRGEKDKKTMLSRALQKANTAVLLDNAQNFEGAMEAYSDACRLLQQVMLRSSGEDDRKKLEAIRVTYTNRIQELRMLDPAWQASSGKALPTRPMSDQSLADTQSFIDNVVDDDEEDPVVIETATITRIVNDKSVEAARTQTSFQKRPARESVISSAIRDVESSIPKSSEPEQLLSPPMIKPGASRQHADRSNLDSPMERNYLPPPLSPRRSRTPNASADFFDEPSMREPVEHRSASQASQASQHHHRAASNESISWLDTIDESGGSSCSSSVHSLQMGTLQRKQLRYASGATEAEFDAALDAAVEAAYDDNLEPYEEEGLMSPYRRNVELARERVREAERETAIEAAKRHDRDMRMRGDSLPHIHDGSLDLGGQSEEADDEERILDEMTRDYMMDDFDFGLQSKSALPRQSDSSTFSGSTWHSSMSSARNTAGTSLSTVTELETSPTSTVNSKPLPERPANTLPPVSESEPQTAVPVPPTSSHKSSGSGGASSVRSRRLSGQNAKQLKIETSIPANQGPLTQPPYTLKVDETPALPKTANATLPNTSLKMPGTAPSQANLQAPSLNSAAVSPVDGMPSISPTPSLTQAVSHENITSDPTIRTKTTGPPPPLRKNKSSLSLRNRQMSVSSPDGSDVSVGTPLSTTFTTFSQRKPSNPQIAQTPGIPTFTLDGMTLPTGGMHLFEADIHSPYSPGSPNPLAINAPIPLEPCPESYLLRPFWLMRCFYQTLAHPRGGYLSTKLFVPRDIWNVKGVKIKSVEEKISNIDLLTAALLKLGRVDTLDADATLEEMQALELVLDQVQSNLVKKLGSEVGTGGVSAMFKDAQTVGVTSPDGSTATELPSRLGGTSNRYLNTWKKLRSKNSGVNLANIASSKDVSKDSLTMSTLPMTTLPNIRFAKREVPDIEFVGPNANYMGSLTRLFDAVQVLDQIARQVEDPGLKHSSPTHVGLELSTRHAAEFFGFYICRFVLSDIAMMLDKFIKRGSEWVLI
ncbi:hypothetical protein BK809_0002545 [Diplodia seriata]|uniref:MIT domain-containing protein n=1 Tax=Diplodia seriata TaxID=420778 RepID=A0A1S8B1V9_9PEZI|nr:hypothetical protein BK809_0002545 [Diplodia seriata]